METEERRDYAVLVTLTMREEAEVAAAALRADGVDAFIGNTQHCYFNWFYVLALGGLQVMVPRRKLAEAQSLLQERIRENAAVAFDEPVRRRDRWKIWLLVIFIVAPAAIDLVIWYAGLVAGWWDGFGWLGPGVERPGSAPWLDIPW